MKYQFLKTMRFSPKVQFLLQPPAEHVSAGSQLESLADNFVLLGNELGTAQPKRTKTEWKEERQKLGSKVSAYHGIALDNLKRFQKDWPKFSDEFSKVRDQVVVQTDKMTSKLAEELDDLSGQRTQLRETSEFSWKLAEGIRKAAKRINGTS